MHSIRQLTDENEIVKLFPMAIREGLSVGVDIAKLNPDKLWYSLKNCMDNAAIFISEIEGVFTGVMALCAVDSYWSDQISITNLIYWVDPEYRQSGMGKALLLAARDYAIESKIDFTLHVESFEDLERKDKFFKRYGFNGCGGSYIIRGEQCQVQ